MPTLSDDDIEIVTEPLNAVKSVARFSLKHLPTGVTFFVEGSLRKRGHWIKVAKAELEEKVEDFIHANRPKATISRDLRNLMRDTQQRLDNAVAETRDRDQMFHHDLQRIMDNCYEVADSIRQLIKVKR